MKTLRHAWEDICKFDNLLLAYRKAARHKRWRYSVLAFEQRRERNLLMLRDSLRRQTYRPGAHRTFTITRPKPRLIAAAPFADRVVQHALCNVTEPLFESSFIAHTYACIKGRGTHRAVDRYSALARRYPYVLKLDVQRFFPSIDHQILYGLLARRLPEEPVRWLVNALLAGGESACEPVVCYLPARSPASR
jgi:retron-type reverse transcriptase